MISGGSGFLMLRGLIVLIAGMLLSGCTAVAPAGGLLGMAHGGTSPLQIHEQTSVNLSEDNFVLVRTNVFGVSKGFSLLGFITIVPANFTTAMDRMYASAQMTPGQPQTVAHLIVEHSGSYWILFGIPKVEVHADIVQFNPPAATGRPGKRRAAPAERPG